MIQREWNDSLGSADVSWGGVRTIRTAAKETSEILEHLRECINSIIMRQYFRPTFNYGARTAQYTIQLHACVIIATGYGYWL